MNNRLINIYNTLKDKYKSFDIINQTKNERAEQEMIAKFLPKDARVLEFGAGIGSTAIVIDKILDNPELHVVIDPTKRAIDSTNIQKNLTESKFVLIHGFLAKNREYQEKLWEECKITNNFSLKDLEGVIGNKKFNVLVVDCEGAFLYILKDFPEILEEVKLVIIEQDGDRENVLETRKILKENNFECVYSIAHPYIEINKIEELDKLNPEKWHNGIGFHEVYIKFKM